MNDEITITQPMTVRALCMKYAEEYKELPEFSSGKKGEIVGIITKTQLFTDANGQTDKESADETRRWILAFIFTPDDKPFKPMSSKTLTSGQWHALEQWIFGKKPTINPVTSRKETRQAFSHEANLIASWSLYAIGYSQANSEGKRRNMSEILTMILEMLRGKEIREIENKEYPTQLTLLQGGLMTTGINLGGIPKEIKKPDDDIEDILKELGY